jgi:Flp pilus assembly protein TadG
MLISTRRRVADERGQATMEFIVVFPVVLLLVWIAFQFAFIFLANRVALAAAEEGARAARVYSGTAAAGQTRAQRFLSELGTHLLLNPQVQSSRGTDTARVVVTGHAQQVVPGLQLRVSRAAEGPVERFRGDTRP